MERPAPFRSVRLYAFVVYAANRRHQVDVSTVFGRAAFAQLLAAKLTNSALSRIDYSQPGGSGTLCYLSLVEVQN